MPDSFRNAWVEVDLEALRTNAAIMAETVAPAALCAVVKADGYGHGAVESARAALEGGATVLAVALVDEGNRLREAGIDAPILVLSEPAIGAMAQVVASDLTPTLYTADAVRALSAVVCASSRDAYPVHIKVDTGMHRVGAAPADVLELVRMVHRDPALFCEGLFTHFAVADEPDDPFTLQQAEIFQTVVQAVAQEGLRPPLLHCANSAAALVYPHLRLNMVRSGIALYGIAPSAAVPLPAGMRPVMSVHAEVSFAKTVQAGEALSYGQRYRLERDSTIVTVPVGYADGLPRRLSAMGGEVLIAGKRRRIAGTVTMDQTLADCWTDRQIRRGDPVVLLGKQGGEEITANEIGEKTDSIGYEVVCRIGPRLPRRYVHASSVADVRPTIDLADTPPMQPEPGVSDGGSMAGRDESLAGRGAGEHLRTLPPG